MKKVTLKQSVIEAFADDERLALLFLQVKSEVKTIDTLRRWFKSNSNQLRIYDVLLAMSEILEIPIEQLLEIEN